MKKLLSLFLLLVLITSCDKEEDAPNPFEGLTQIKFEEVEIPFSAYTEKEWKDFTYAPDLETKSFHFFPESLKKADKSIYKHPLTTFGIPIIYADPELELFRSDVTYVFDGDKEYGFVSLYSQFANESDKNYLKDIKLDLGSVEFIPFIFDERANIVYNNQAVYTKIYKYEDITCYLIYFSFDIFKNYQYFDKNTLRNNYEKYYGYDFVGQ